MEYLVRFVQRHDTFRIPEFEALALIAGVEMEVLDYQTDSPFCIIRLPNDAAAAALISRSITSHSIHALWASAPNYTDLHTKIRSTTTHLWAQYTTNPFNFSFDSFHGKRPNSERLALIESFAYIGFTGDISMIPSATAFVIHEEYTFRPSSTPIIPPKRVFFSRLVANSARNTINTYDLKKRSYISTTSMDAELSLITANLALAGGGKLHYDPFMGTGSFPIACAHFGATVLGSDIDGRSIRGSGKGVGKNVRGNFVQYGLLDRYLDGFVSDLTNCPLRIAGADGRRWLDGIVCDPPYGVREGLKVLGSVREELKNEIRLADGSLAHLSPSYIPPKRPYSFTAMQSDILDFAATTLVDSGRLCMWMPTANDEDIALAIPTHPAMKLEAICVQEFNKWARRLLTYSRVPERDVDLVAMEEWRVRERGEEGSEGARTANELNGFRRKYFQGFKEQQADDGDTDP